MADFIDENLAAIWAVRVDLYNAISPLEAIFTQAGAALISGDYVSAGGWLQNATASFYALKMRLAWESSSFLRETYVALWRLQYYWPEGNGEVTMDAILSAMVQADPDQLQYFIGIVDAYRQSIWNRPFNKEFFAALARGFEQWP